MSNGGDIIIKGGSLEIQFDDSVYPPGDGHGSHLGQRKMQRIVVVDDQQVVKYDSHNDDPKKWTITVLTGAA